MQNKIFTSQKSKLSYNLINQFNGLYQILDVDDNDIIGQFLPLTMIEQAVNDFEESLFYWEKLDNE